MRRELRDGLILRSGRPDDVEPLAAFYADCIRFQDQPEPELRFAAWTRDLLTHHPTLTPTDALVVEDARAGIVASASLVVPQTLALGGVRISAIQPELIATRVPRLLGSVLVVGGFEVAAGVSWRMAWEAVLTYLRATGEEYAAQKGAAAFTSLGFWWLGRDHPLYRVVNFRDFRREAALYVRVPRLADLLRHLRPVLERRLAASPLAGHSIDLRLGFYRTGVRVRIEVAPSRTWRTGDRRSTLSDRNRDCRQPSRGC